MFTEDDTRCDIVVHFLLAWTNTPIRQNLALMFSYSISVLLADCVDPVRGFLLSCASRIVVFAFAPVVGHVLTEEFRHRSLGMANGSFHDDHLLRWVDDNEVCSRRRWNHGNSHCSES